MSSHGTTRNPNDKVAETQEEYLDALTETGELIGPVPRSKAHKEGIWHRVIHLWVINKYVLRKSPSSM